MCSDFFSEAHVLRYTEPLGYQSDQLISHHFLTDAGRTERSCEITADLAELYRQITDLNIATSQSQSDTDITQIIKKHKN